MRCGSRVACWAIVAGLAAANVAPAGASDSSATWSYLSAPNLHPPKLQVLVRKPGLARGDFLAATTPPIFHGHTTGEGGPLILDSRARPVWFMPDKGAFDLQQEVYAGQPVLVWFQGNLGVVHRGGPQHQQAQGEVVIYDEHYRKIASLTARSPWTIDLHDASIVGGDIRITVIRAVTGQNLTRYGGPRHGTVIDVGAQEFQISTGRLIRTWDALNPHGRPNVPLSASYQRASSGWDAYHLNALQALPNGDLLVSMRNTWAVSLINPVTGHTLWTLGGKDSTLTVARSARFAWQHDARLVDPSGNGQGQDTELTMFDDNSSRGPAKGLLLRLNTITRRATLVAAYPHHPSYDAQFLGSMQILPNGNALVDWGSPYGYFTEFSKTGRQLLNVGWPDHGQSYRTLFTDTWVGTPYYPPRGAARGETVYASWNGATQVARWEVLAGSSPGSLRVVASEARDGFETAIRLGQAYAAYQVRALSASGQALGTSKRFS